MILADVKVWQAFRFLPFPDVYIRRSRLQLSHDGDRRRVWFEELALRCEVELVEES